MQGIPRLATGLEYEYLAAAVAHLLRDREAKYPPAVTAGTMSAVQAADGLEAMRVVTKQWRWVIDKARPALPEFDHENGRFGADNRVLEAEMARIAANARARAERSPSDTKRAEMADLCEALAWYQVGDCGDPRIVWYHLDREAAAMSAAA